MLKICAIVISEQLEQRIRVRRQQCLLSWAVWIESATCDSERKGDLLRVSQRAKVTPCILQGTESRSSSGTARARVQENFVTLWSRDSMKIDAKACKSMQLQMSGNGGKL